MKNLWREYNGSVPEEDKHRALRAETLGLLVLALLLALMVLARWGRLIPWSAR